MPAGVSIGAYIRFCLAATFSMAVGSQIVHQYYKPLQDLNDYIEREIVNLPLDFQEKVRARMTSTSNT